MLSVTAADRLNDPYPNARVGPDAKPRNPVALEIFEVEPASGGRDFAGVVEQHRIERWEDLPPILCLQQDQVAVTQPKVAEAPKVVRAPSHY